jgi:hypothetical protein
MYGGLYCKAVVCKVMNLQVGEFLSNCTSGGHSKGLGLACFYGRTRNLFYRIDLYLIFGSYCF